MSYDLAFERLRAADPAPVEAAEAEELFDAIVSQPADPRLRRKRRRATRRWQFVAVAAAALVVGVAAAWAAGSGDLRSIFASNPAGGGTPGHPPTGLWRQVAIPSTIQRVGVLSVPKLGDVELWTAETEQHGWCSALRLPDGTWSGMGGTSGGAAPGCYPSRAATNAASGTPVYVLNGFDYYETTVDARDDGGRFWRIVYGVTELPQPAARIVDTVSGHEVTISKGRFFGLLVPDDHPGSPSPKPLYHLLAYDRSGKVIADSDKPLP
jgi:hypothetical protein